MGLGGTVKRRLIFACSFICLLIGFVALPGNASGYLDTSFGQHGTAVISAGTGARVAAMAFGNSGRIWVAANDATDTFLFALTSSGKLDTAFNSGRPVSPGPRARAFAIEPRADGGVNLIGEVCCDGSEQPFPLIEAFLANGSIDNSYGNGMGYDDGYVWPPNSNDTTQDFFSAVVLPSGAVRECGVYRLHPTSTPQMILDGTTASGHDDTTVGANGNRFIPGMTDCHALAVDGSGNLLATGTVTENGKSYIRTVRMAANGDVDTTYGTNGYSTVKWSGRSIRQRAGIATVDQQGGLLLGLATQDPGQRWMAATLRLSSTGSIDAAYGYGGMYRYVPTTGSSAISSLDVTRNGKAMISLTYATPTGTQLRLVRISAATGRVDPTFGSNGLVQVSVVGASVLTDSVGRLLLGGPVPSNAVSYVQRRWG